MNITLGFFKCDGMYTYLVIGLFLFQEQTVNPGKTGPICPENSPGFSILLIHPQQCKDYSYQVLAVLEKADLYCHFHSIGYPNWQGLYDPPNPAFLTLLNFRTIAL